MVTKNDEPLAEAADPPVEAASPSQPPRPQVQVDDSNLDPLYTNFCRVTGTPEEIILDFGLNTEPFGQSTTPVKLNMRLVSNFYTAKRLLMALNVAIQRHEATFGVLETDVNKRVQAKAGAGS